jgi:hypothetical protein
MNIQEHLSAFDSWLTTRLDEAHARRRDLAFRDLIVDERSGVAPWEYSLLEPGARRPQGEGWSVYRLNGVWPEIAGEPAPDPGAAPTGGRRSFLEMITKAVFGRGPQGG